MKDSTGMIHRPLVKDMLAKTYNFMTKNKFDVKNPTQVYRAEVQSMGYHPSEKYCAKFVSELDYIKKVAEQQPITTVTFTRRFWSEDKTWVDVGGIETEVLKTYDRTAVGFFKAQWNNKDNSYVIKDIVTINENNLDIN